jgi:hypothetical protein
MGLRTGLFHYRFLVANPPLFGFEVEKPELCFELGLLIEDGLEFEDVEGFEENQLLVVVGFGFGAVVMISSR